MVCARRWSKSRRSGTRRGLPDRRIVGLIPCYNAAPWIPSTLDSVLRQSHPRIEVIVVDDGSTDGSAEIVQRCVPPGTRLLRQERRGAGAARNAALREATGAFLQFLDADDLLSPGKIERQVRDSRRAPLDPSRFREAKPT